MDLLSLIRQLQDDRILELIANNPAAQFGIPQRPYLGPTLLPERMVPQNEYTEAGIRYQTVIANDGSRYSPAQKKDTGELVGSFKVSLGDQDILRELNGADYDALLLLLRSNATMDAVLTVTQFVDQTVNRALIEKTELQRWEALVSAQVVRTGDNGYSETVTYPNPAGHRAAAGGSWSSDAYDPFADIAAMVDLLADKGYTVNRIVTSRKVVNILLRNDKMTLRSGRFLRLAASELIGRGNLGDLNSMMQAEGLPPFETYDLQYRTQAGTARFLADTVLVLLATTGRDTSIASGAPTGSVAAGDRFLADTLGYTAIGRAVGEATPGRNIKVFPYDNKPPRIEAEGKQTSLPVITEPEAIAVITGIA